MIQCSASAQYAQQKSTWNKKIAQNAQKKGVNLNQLKNTVVLQKIARMKEIPLDTAVEKIQYLINEIDSEFLRIEEMRENINA